MTPINLDHSIEDADWPKRARIDLPEINPLNARTFRAWMDQMGLTVEHVRRLPLNSPENRATYPWLADVLDG